ncbi:GTP 3',8-cyclase MoaA [Agrobacterium tumefaciens]|uniref:GTP 3',8-cyclase n=1 Tax=Agrobacterium tumefaciens TaxID=358 RepID=A0AA44F2W7_AGRTU|nr:GTP 3',8-cyclase MoaA [Agrobacterium tumefaciens]NSL22977.1 GTP 3',8-cyclase MoaA [Agrobacterium tumefaciens]NTB89217.1 GTP 3',8-cyclase MoaA [Agrobacterium tumefaciens]NTC20488.1 GTP 3',8-cyclase MoaA [Agrobacterium tumefaciens]NTC27858.1 GTP 3',8-cyclase MoaA [Agrobacterium tumefaciens]NTC53474.1 GTP 3',8-cyclase MoaA [Agrobacterium tumefaciens]
METPSAYALVDSFGRRVSYLRLSVTDRCDLRCVYCMSERMTFMPRRDVLSLDELARVAQAFIRIGVRKIRITGGEPLVRKDIIELFRNLSTCLRDGSLQELTLTTNGTRLARHARDLALAGVRRVNISLDTLDPHRFSALTRGGSLATVLEGIDAAQDARLAVKINAVALCGSTENEIDDLISFAHKRGMGLTLIETMPLGETGEDRLDQYLPLDRLRRQIAGRWSLTDIGLRTGGPARYVRVDETGGIIGFITPMTHNFCENCNRVRVTAAGVLHTCLGQNDAADLKEAIRASEDNNLLLETIAHALKHKPKGHDFVLDRASVPQIARHMSATGG